VLPTTALTGDVPSQHLMCPVPSAGRRHQGHPAGGAPAGSAGKQCARAERRTILIFSSASTIFFMSLGPHVGAQSFCACPPSAIKGEAYDVTNGRLSDLALGGHS
jgi:hypothetical protein